MIFKNITDKIRNHPLYVALMVAGAIASIYGLIYFIKSKPEILNVKKISVTPTSSSSDMEIFDALPIKQLIESDKTTNDFYRFSCPVFTSSAQEHFSWLKECVPLKFGALGSFNGKNFYFGTYDFSNDSEAGKEGIIIFEGNNSSDFIEPIIFRVQLNIYPKSSTLGYAEPRVIYTKYGPILEISCALGGVSAIAYDSQQFIWNGSKWKLLDNESWMDDLRNKLPEGLSIWNYEPIDLNNLVYTSPLWKVGEDPHCCPTGGTVKVYLKISQNRFIIDRLKISKKKP